MSLLWSQFSSCKSFWFCVVFFCFSIVLSEPTLFFIPRFFPLLAHAWDPGDGRAWERGCGQPKFLCPSLRPWSEVWLLQKILPSPMSQLYCLPHGPINIPRLSPFAARARNILSSFRLVFFSSSFSSFFISLWTKRGLASSACSVSYPPLPTTRRKLPSLTPRANHSSWIRGRNQLSSGMSIQDGADPWVGASHFKVQFSFSDSTLTFLHRMFWKKMYWWLMCLCFCTAKRRDLRGIWRVSQHVFVSSLHFEFPRDDSKWSCTQFKTSNYDYYRD